MYIHTELPRHASIDKIREDSDVLSPQLKLSVAGRRSHHDCAFAWEYKTSDSGQPGTLEHRVHIFKSTPGQAMERHVSPWHDVPLKNTDGTFNFVCEIPKETRAKMEMATGEPGNAIKQDTKKGELRYYAMNIHWNYGALPQTWEDPNHSNAELGGIFGDNDPVDVVEIGSKPLETGSIYKVKVLGVLAMIDDGELDWKVVAINAEDPLAAKLDDVPDVERECPGELTRIYEWFRDYKIPDGKPPNHFAYDGQCQPKARAMEVIEETHAFWLDLVSLPTPRWPQGLAKHAFSRTPTHFSPRPAPIAE